MEYKRDTDCEAEKMTIKEAIKDIKEIKPYVGGKSLNMAIEALEKQIPKKVIRYSYTTDVCCPYCGEVVLYSYCRNCGQRLDWSEKSRIKDGTDNDI